MERWNKMSEEEKQAIETMHTIVEFGGDNLLCKEHRKRLQIVLNLIEKQNKVIDKMLEHIHIHTAFSTNLPYGATKEEWKDYFYREVENE